MANFSLPTISSLYTDVISILKGRDDDIAKMFDGTGSTNIPTNAIGWSSTNSRFEKWNGSSWAALDSAYEINVTSFNGQAASYYTNASNLVSGTLPAARFNDISHGNRGNGSLHSVATTSVAGFMSASDKVNADKLTGMNATASELNDVDRSANTYTQTNLTVRGGTTAGTTQTYTAYTQWVRVGNIVTCNLWVYITNLGNMAGQLEITGFPNNFVGSPAFMIERASGMTSYSNANNVIYLDVRNANTLGLSYVTQTSTSGGKSECQVSGLTATVVLQASFSYITS